MLPPKQETFVCEVETDNAVGCETVVLFTTEQPFESVTETLYVPAVNPEMEEAVEVVFHKYVYPAVPPEGLTLAVPLFPPLQLTEVLEMVAVN